MGVFRCYITGSDGHFRDVVSLEAASDLEALTRAKALPKTHAGFELWNGPRLVYQEPAIADVPVKEDDPIRDTFGTRLKAVVAKVEKIAASIGETFSGTQSLAVVRSKEKRRPRD